ncbi:MAG: hypothetical protein MZW92_19730 [Comamonadaceae bacterium]|nr:hypothetical protein [Comamonadaceae bacterium]
MPPQPKKHAPRRRPEIVFKARGLASVVIPPVKQSRFPVNMAQLFSRVNISPDEGEAAGVLRRIAAIRAVLICPGKFH